MCGPDTAEAPTLPYRTPRCLRPTAVASQAAIPDGTLIIENFSVTFEGHTYPHGRIAYVTGRPPAPVVFVHHNYAGLKQFDIDQAAFLARVGYVGVAVDHYRETASYTFEDRDPRRNINPGLKPQKLTQIQRDKAVRHGQGAFQAMNDRLRNPKHWRGMMAAYITQADTHPAVRAGFAAAIGYCFGGQCCLEQVRAGHKLQAVVSFHGLLQSIPLNFTDPKESMNARRLTAEEFAKEVDAAENLYDTKCKVLIENGDHDGEVPQSAIDAWRAEMDANVIDWRFNNHARTPHGFALAPGVWSTAYHEDADRRSTISMLSLFTEVWPEYPQYLVETNACGTVLGQRVVSHRAKL